MRKLTHKEDTGEKVANFLESANGLNVIAACISNFVGLYKFHFPEGKMSFLQEFQADFAQKDSTLNCLKWSLDNSTLVVGGEDRSVRVYKVVNAKDFTVPLELQVELKGGHYDTINGLDISPAKTLVLSSGQDCQANVWNIAQKRTMAKLTFSDTECKNIRGDSDTSNFPIKGCCFSKCSRFIFVLAARPKYKSFVVKYSVAPSATGIVTFPLEAIDVHNH